MNLFIPCVVHYYLHYLIISTFNFDYTISLKLTLLHVPRSIHRGESTWLNCSYDPGRDKIYSVKWYKNDVEFYRYLPTEKPSIQYYASSGLSIDVSKSALANVYLTESTFQTEGLYRCEVSADAPSFQTVAREKRLKVYYIPESGPTIEPIKWTSYTHQNTYPVIDLICASNPSKPSTQLSWLINDQPAPSQYLSHNITHNTRGLEVTQLRLTLPNQFVSLVGRLDLKCISRFILTHIDQLHLTIRPNFVNQQNEENVQRDTYSMDQTNKTFNVSINHEDESNLFIKGYQLVYKVNDFVNLSCHALKSRIYHKTKPMLKWLINDDEASIDMTEEHQNEDFGEYTLRLGIDLSERFFDIWSTFDGKNGPKIILKCIAIHEEVLFHASKDWHHDRQNVVISSARESMQPVNNQAYRGAVNNIITIGLITLLMVHFYCNSSFFMATRSR